METAKELQEKLAIRTRIKEIDNEISNAACPICGSKLQLAISEGGGDSCIIPASAEITCNNCKMFGYKLRLTSQETYMWKNDGTSELMLKQRIWSNVKRFIKS